MLFLCSAEVRYHSVLMRARFDETRKIKDPRVLAAMVAEGEEEAFRKVHFKPFAYRVS